MAPIANAPTITAAKTFFLHVPFKGLRNLQPLECLFNATGLAGVDPFFGKFL
jgi:hypothetical protein